jgi:hypothetical protein
MKGTGSPDCCSFSDPRLQKRGDFYFGESGHFHFGTTPPLKSHLAWSIGAGFRFWAKTVDNL